MNGHCLLIWIHKMDRSWLECTGRIVLAAKRTEDRKGIAIQASRMRLFRHVDDRGRAGESAKRLLPIRSVSLLELKKIVADLITDKPTRSCESRRHVPIVEEISTLTKVSIVPNEG